MAQSSYSIILQLKDLASSQLAKVSTGFTGIVNTMGKQAERFNYINQNVSMFNNTLAGITAPGMEFQHSLKELSAIAQPTAEQLGQIEKNARQLALTFGGDANKQVDSFQKILSKISPELAKSPQALKNMATASAMLGTTMKGDVVGATDALTSAFNAYNISLKDPIKASGEMARMMDMITAGTNVGSAEVRDIARAIEKVGGEARNAGVDFATLNASLQILDQKGFKKAEEGGIAFRNVINKMTNVENLEVKTIKKLKDAGVSLQVLTNKSLPLVTRLKELQKIQKNGALVAKMFEIENKTAAMSMIENAETIGKWSGEIEKAKGTTKNMVKEIQSSTKSQTELMKAYWSDLGISVFNASKEYLPQLQAMGALGQTASGLMPIMAMMGKGLMWAGNKALDLGMGLAKATMQTAWFGTKLLAQGVYSVGAFTVSLAKASTVGLWQFVLSLQKTNFSLSTWITKMMFASGFVISKFQTRMLALQTQMKAFSFQNFITGLWASGVAATKTGLQFIWAGVQGLGTFLRSMAMATLAQLGLNVAMSANPIGLVVVGLAAIGAAVYALVANWDTVKGWIVGVWDTFQQYNPFRYLWEYMQNLFPAFTGMLSNWWTKIMEFVKSIGSGIADLWNKIAPALGLGEMNVNFDSSMGELEKSMGVGGDSQLSNLGVSKGGSLMDLAGNSTGGKGSKSGLGAGISEIKSDAGTAKNLTINIEKLVESLNINTTNLTESASRVREEITKVLLSATNDVNLAV